MGGLCAAVQVTVESPAASATVGSPVQFAAIATSAYPITGFVIYANNQNVYQINGSSLYASVALGAGTYSIYIRAWDSTGAYGTSPTFAITVGATTTSGVQVAVQSPAGGATVASPVQFAATASSAHPITGFVVYANNQNVYQANGSSLNASVALGAGTYSVYIRAWDSTGAYGTSPAFSIAVGAASSSLPVPPSTAVTISQIEDTTDNWSNCSTCAGGGSSTTNYWTAPFQTSPSRDGSSREFYNGSGAWSNVLWIKKFGNQDAYSHFLWDFWVYFDPTSAANLWAAEYDLWQSVSGQEFMMGSQCDFGLGRWDVWNSATKHWIGTGIPCPRFAGNTWHHIQWYMQRISWNQYKFVTLVVDGVPYTLNWAYYTSGENWADSLGVQWQLDLNGSGIGAHEWVDQVKLTFW